MGVFENEGLTAGQAQALIWTERVNSIVSLICVLFILITYLFTNLFEKPINRLIFFASWANMGSSIGVLISEAGPNAGQGAPLCQFQAFALQMFLGVDTYYGMCMAINVYLAFFKGYTIPQLRKFDIPYMLLCYGISLIPALAFLFINTSDRGMVYGPAAIWCWIDSRWDPLRIPFLYGPSWVAMIVAAAVYVAAAKVIYKKRELLDGFLNPLNENPFANIVTTEIEITHQPRPSMSEAERARTVDLGLCLGKSIGNTEHTGMAEPEFNSYEVKIEIGQQEKGSNKPTLLQMRELTRQVAEQESNAEAWLYARVAILFFLALCITWVPSSINRMYALAHPDQINFGLNYAASFVFPLQGLWNVVVYCITSQTACKELWSACFPGRNRRASAAPSGSGLGRKNSRGNKYGMGKLGSAGRQRLGSQGDDGSMASFANH